MTTPLPPPTLDNGRYIIERVIGAGGMSAVLLASDTRLGVQRAIKLLSRQYHQSDQLRTRFKNEAHAQAELRHPNILMVHDVVEDEQGLYLVMELAEQGSLAGKVYRQGPLSPREVADVGVTMGKALAVAHASGVIHRDIKPDNMLIDRHGTLKLADFGIAHVADRNPNLTRTGMIIGTWAYMPPEQRESTRDADHRADIYALGATLYKLLTGQMASTLHNRETHARAFEGVPDALARVIIQCTRFEPDDRYPTCTELVDDLAAIRDALSEAPLFAPSANPKNTESALPLISDILPTGHANLTAVPAVEDLETETAEVPAKTITPVTQVTRRTRSTLLLVGLAAGLSASMGVALLVARLMLPQILGTDTEPITAVTPPTIPDAPLITAEPEPEPEAEPEPEVPVEVASTSPVKAPVESAESEVPDPPPVEDRTPRIITVIPRTGGGGAPSESVGSVGSDDSATMGTLLLRTVPSGATVTERGVSVPRGGGGYRLGVGHHLLTVQSPSGEQTQLPVTIRSAGQVVEICYSFDTNGSCTGPG